MYKRQVQGVLWGLNSFDQPGVELGKVLAKRIEACLEDAKSSEMNSLDVSTLGLLGKIAAFQKANG